MAAAGGHLFLLMGEQGFIGKGISWDELYVMKYTLSGELVDQFGADWLLQHNAVFKFAPDGEFLTRWGEVGSGDGQFFDPVGIAVSGGHVWVLDHYLQRVQEFIGGSDPAT